MDLSDAIQLYVDSSSSAFAGLERVMLAGGLSPSAAGGAPHEWLFTCDNFHELYGTLAPLLSGVLAGTGDASVIFELRSLGPLRSLVCALAGVQPLSEADLEVPPAESPRSPHYMCRLASLLTRSAWAALHTDSRRAWRSQALTTYAVRGAGVVGGRGEPSEARGFPALLYSLYKDRWTAREGDVPAAAALGLRVLAGAPYGGHHPIGVTARRVRSLVELGHHAIDSPLLTRAVALTPRPRGGRSC
jgi:hypothetical protein